MPNHNLISRIDAIRHGFDDRLLVLVECEPNATIPLDIAADRIRAWRYQFEDELEVLAFVRIGPYAEHGNTMNVEAQCEAVRYLSSQALPVAVAAPSSLHEPGLDTPIAGYASPTQTERWLPCKNDLRYLLEVARLPGELLLCERDTRHRSHAFPSDCFIGPGYAASHAQQTAFVEDFARRILLHEDAGLGAVLAPLGTHANSTATDGNALLAALADAVYLRRIRCAA